MAEHTALQQTLPWSIAGSSRMYQGTLAIVDRNNQNVLWAAGFDGDDGCDCCVGGDALGLAVVRAVNCHKELVEALEDCKKLAREAEGALPYMEDEDDRVALRDVELPVQHIWAIAETALAKATAHETRIQQQDMAEETL